MADKHCVVRTDLMHGTDAAPETGSLKFYTVDGATYTPADIDNGNVALLKALDENERDLWTAVAPAADSKLTEVVWIASVELPYEERYRNLSNYYNEAGLPARYYRFHPRAIFSMTEEGFAEDSVLEKGSIVELAAGTKLKAAKTATAGSTAVGKIIRIEKTSRYTFYVVQVD